MIFDLSYQQKIKMEALLILTFALWVARYRTAKHLCHISGNPINQISEKEDDDENW